MTNIRQYTYAIIFLMFLTQKTICQEFNLKTNINTNRVNSVDKQQINELETQLKEFINMKIWSNSRFESYEKITGSAVLNLSSFDGINNYEGELNINISRPVYNSSYTTSLFNIRDKNLSFAYNVGQNLNYNEIMPNDELISTIVFYLYIILGLDADSFSLNGGKLYFQKAMNIANTMQSSNTKGWEAFDGKSKYDLAFALLNDKLSSFHSLWYNYHRGLDEMNANVNRGKIRIIDCLKNLEEISKEKPNSILLSLFIDTKFNEFLQVCAKTDTAEKKELKKRLTALFPSKKILIDNSLK